jgi:EAL domain-containing protein (putative c-di-GMP-specific phosphodiesterase class I)
LRAIDTAGRLGGDEFIVICEGIRDLADLESVTERLREAARLSVNIDGTTLFASASVGCTLSRPEARADELVAEADTALYRAKLLGRGRCELFDEQMRSDSLMLLQLRGQLTEALARNEFRLHYQPIVDVTRSAAIGYEALIRWQHPTRGLLLPGEFLDVAADSELEPGLTRWVLERACADVRQFDAEGHAVPFVAVNLSTRQLARGELARDVEEALRAAELEPQRLWLEVTEQQVLDGRHRAALHELRELGCRIVLDDFGTGYCGLAYLQQLPVHVLKIDREFVARISTDRVSAGITAAVTDLAGLLDILVVAEGVEAEEQADALRGMGIQLMQGYSFGRPQPLHAWTGRDLPRQRSASAPVMTHR